MYAQVIKPVHSVARMMGVRDVGEDSMFGRDTVKNVVKEDKSEGRGR